MCTVILAYIHPQCLEHFVSQLASAILDDLYVLSSVSGKRIIQSGGKRIIQSGGLGRNEFHPCLKTSEKVQKGRDINTTKYGISSPQHPPPSF